MKLQGCSLYDRQCKYCKSYQQNISLKPGIQYTFQGKFNEFLYGSMINFGIFEAGIWARNDVKLRYDSFILSFGFLRDNYNFHYSYDVNVKKTKQFSLGMAAHEVTFLYNFKV
ncbi:MAG: type IX secretion system membrane protein PorP/SprF [Bacteroidales bacterium]|nr:type IX secretion system membrane protein PorP/SprF [Bacteroidales bacterium]